MELIVAFAVGALVGVVAGVMGYRRRLKKNPELVDRIAAEIKAAGERIRKGS